jgi:hypothetical protein
MSRKYGYFAPDDEKALTFTLPGFVSKGPAR